MNYTENKFEMEILNNVHVKVNINGRRLNSALVVLLLLLGLKSFVRLLHRLFVQIIWQGVKDGWSGAFGLRRTEIEHSNIFNDGWPSMKNIFRAVFKRK